MNDVETAHRLRPIAPPSIDGASFGIAHPRPYWCGVTVGQSHVSEVIEHMNNIELVRLIDRAAELHSDSVGYTRQELLKNGIMWFVARHEIDYLAESWPGDDLVVATWVRNFSRVKSWRDYVILRPADETVICRATTLWVLVDLATRKPTRISQDMADRFCPLDGGATQVKKSTGQQVNIGM